MAPGPGPPSTATSGQGTAGNAISFDDQDRQSVALEFRDFLEKKEGSALRAWLHHFDRNNDQKISLSEFMRGMRRLSYPGDITAVFTTLDADRSGELSLDEVDQMQAHVWRKFRMWCVGTFDGVKSMMRQLSSSNNPEERVNCNQFCNGLQKAGWDGEWEEIIFNALDFDNAQHISPHNLKWLEMEKRRQRRKEQAKRRSVQENVKRDRLLCVRQAQAVLQDFKQFLRRKYGHYIRAWCIGLSPDRSMTIQKGDLFKACSNIGWQGDVRVLWQALDSDESGWASLAELDAKSAETLAHFCTFIQDRFGSAAAAFRAFDKFNAKKLRQADFLGAVKSHGFQYPAKVLFHGLDHSGTKSIVEEDLHFLDKWKPPAYLVASPNYEAADEFKNMLLKFYKNYLKAWRHVLDADGSNRCNWEEFGAACKKVGYSADIPGAWRALDDDLSGYITLMEIDPVSSTTLGNFKSWADEEFGGVRAAFGLFDSDNSNEVTYREFRRACRVYGFDGNVHLLFHALDVERSGTLSLDEVVFLDEWEFNEDPAQEGAAQERAIVNPHSAAQQLQNQLHIVDLTDFNTEGPGPAAYMMPSTVGAGPTAPMVHFSGAFSFRKRPESNRLPGLQRDSALLPAPTTYNDKLYWDMVSKGKPAWGFGSEARLAYKQNATPESKSPGPGQYVLPSRQKGPAATFASRRPLKVHPLYREDLSSRGQSRGAPLSRQSAGVGL